MGKMKDFSMVVQKAAYLVVAMENFEADDLVACSENRKAERMDETEVAS